MTGLQQEQVGIVGAGALGKALAGHLARCGIPGVICNSRAPATLEAFVRTLGPTIRAATLEEAVGPEIVIMAVPWVNVPVVLERAPEWEGRIIIDATHPPCRENGSPLGRDSASPGERIVGLAPGAHVVMAFNTLPAAVLAQPPMEASGRRVIFYSGDHTRAKRKVASLIARLGFAAVDLGTLAEGGRLQLSPSGSLAMLNFVQLAGTPPPGP
jgi:predicted dinucleotide-binding enzyme